MIEWLQSIIGVVPQEYEFIVVIGAVVLVIIVVVNIINALFSPFRLFK